MPILLWVVFPLAVWYACADQALSATKMSDMPRESGARDSQ